MFYYIMLVFAAGDPIMKRRELDWANSLEDKGCPASQVDNPHVAVFRLCGLLNSKTLG